MLEKKIGFIGAGQMARALGQGFVDAQLIAPHAIVASDPAPIARDAFAQLIPAARVLESNRETVEQSDVIFLAVKPQYVEGAASEIRSAIDHSKLIVSIVAGAPLGKLRGVTLERTDLGSVSCPHACLGW